MHCSSQFLLRISLFCFSRNRVSWWTLQLTRICEEMAAKFFSHERRLVETSQYLVCFSNVQSAHDSFRCNTVGETTLMEHFTFS